MGSVPRPSEKTIYELWDEVERARTHHGEAAASAMAARAFRAALGLPVTTDASSGIPPGRAGGMDGAAQQAAGVTTPRMQPRRAAPFTMKGRTMNEDIMILADELHGGNYRQLCYAKQRAFERYIKTGQVDRAVSHAAVLSMAQLEEAIREGWEAREVKATMNESQDTQGGFLTAETVREQVLGRAATLAVVRPRATIDTAGPNGGLGMPVWQGSGDIYPSGLHGYWTSETQSMAGLDENPTLGVVKPPINLWRLRVKASKSLLEDAGARLVNNLTRLFGETVATAEDAAELVGEGVGRPLGILAQQVPGTLSNSSIRVVNSGNASALTGDGIRSLIYALPGQYRDAPTAVVTCNTATLKAICLLKDGSGRYIFNEDTGLLCGKPVVTSESMPDIAANAYPVLFGDMTGYYIADRLGMALERYDDSSVADEDKVVFYVRRRVGGTPGEGYRFAALKVSA